ncbi:MAG: DUF192 domain-containing protein [bacterium]
MKHRGPALRLPLIFLFLPIIPLSCGSNSDDMSDLHELQTGDHVFQVEIADTEETRSQGLMHRDELPENHGMLFVFDRDQRMSFWMKNTSIPLSIAYISSDGVIREIHDMEPHDLDSVRSSRSARYALEVNQGAFERNGIEVGDQVDVFGLPDARE